jgi:opacity protein-like surface antigen
MKVLLSLACAGLTAAAGPAFGADLFGTAPPSTYPAIQDPATFEVGSNWYVRGDLGISFDNAPTLSLSNISIPPPGYFGAPLPAYAGTNMNSRDFTGGVGFGYRVNNYLRFDATWDYRNGPGGSSETTVVCPYALSGLTTQGANPFEIGYLYNTSNTCDGAANIRQYNNTFLANGYVDLGTYAGFTPYVGGGLGFNMNVMSGSLNYYETANGQAYAADLTPTGTFPQIWVNQYGAAITPQPNIAFAPQNWSRSINATTYAMAFALTAGFGFQLTPSATLDIGYRYLNSGSVNKLISPETGMTVRQGNTSQQLLVGIRYVLQ